MIGAPRGQVCREAGEAQPCQEGAAETRPATAATDEHLQVLRDGDATDAQGGAPKVRRFPLPVRPMTND